MGGKEGDDNYWECCAPRGPVLPKSCYRRGVNFKNRANATRYVTATLEDCFDKCKGRCKGLMYNEKHKSWKSTRNTFLENI